MLERHKEVANGDGFDNIDDCEVPFADRLSNLLILAILREFDSCVSLLLEGGANVDFRESGTGWGLLYVAVMEESLAATQLLLRYGAPLDDHHFFSPLALAAHKGKIDIMRSIMEAGANTNVGVEFDFGVYDLFQAAATYHNAEMMELLLLQGMSVDSSLYRNASHPLTLAARSGNIDVVRLLLNNGVGVNVVKRALREYTTSEIRRLLRESIRLRRERQG
jgi:ankyrin repeat protein